MAEHPKFKIWVNRELFFRGASPEERVEKDMRPENLLVQGRQNDTWMVI
jgi:hypothetical protein